MQPTTDPKPTPPTTETPPPTTTTAATTTTTDSDETSKKNIRRCLIAGGVVLVALAIPVVSALLCSEDSDKEEETEKEKAKESAKLTASAVLDKLVGWVREVKSSADEKVDEVADHVQVELDIPQASVVDFARTQSV